MSGKQPRSAGILLFRRCAGLEVLLGHPGGPFWRSKDKGAWSVPKGLVEPGEDPKAAALREFSEETGMTLAPGKMIELGGVRLRSGKTVVAWGMEGDFDPTTLRSNPVRLEIPRGSGRFVEFPEIDEVRWYPLEEARRFINPGQIPLLDRLQESLNHPA